MRASKYVKSSEFQRNIGAMIFEAMTGEQNMIVTSHARPVAALISKAEYDEYRALLRAQGERERVLSDE